MNAVAEARRFRVLSALWLTGLSVLALACSDDDPDAQRTDSGLRDAGQDAAEADGGGIDPEELARRISLLERELRDAQQRLTDLTTPAGQQDLITHLAQPLLAATCAHAQRCCTGEELVLQLGEGVASARACESQLLSLAQRATSLDVRGVNAALFQWVSEALALQRFAVDGSAVQACADALAQAPCEHVDDGRCQPPDREDPCLPARLLRSVALSGDPCEASSSLPQCAPGLACKALPTSGARCVGEGKEGDGCAQDGDCANAALFCGPTTRRCERRRELGESCSHTSPDAEFDGCAAGLECDSHACVLACESGAACNPEHDNRDCAAGLVCVDYLQRCAPPQNRRECARDSECPTGSRCSPDGTIDGPRCQPPLGPGAACARQGQGCDGGFCVNDPATQRFVCRASCAGDEACANDEYCATKCSQMTQLCSWSDVGCNPRLPDGSTCIVDFADARDDRQCASGYCDHATSTCQPRNAADSACERSAQCPISQYCQTGMCRPLVAAGADCADLAAHACGPDWFCRDNAGQHTCTPSPRQGDACDTGTGTGLVCPDGSGLR